LFPFAGSDQLLGYTIAHQLGHRPNGIMRASWSKPELAALKYRRLKFSDWERAAIRQKLAARRKTAPAANVPK